MGHSDVTLTEPHAVAHVSHTQKTLYLPKQSKKSSGGRAVDMNPRVSGSIPGSSWLLAEVSLEKTPKPCSSTDMYCLAAVQPLFPQEDQ